MTDERVYSNDPKYHDEAVMIASIMGMAGWKAFIERLDRQKKLLIAKIERNESDIEVSAVEKKGEYITIVMLNKDENKIKLGLLRALEGEFAALRAESVKISGGTDNG